MVDGDEEVDVQQYRLRQVAYNSQDLILLTRDWTLNVLNPVEYRYQAKSWYRRPQAYQDWDSARYSPGRLHPSILRR